MTNSTVAPLITHRTHKTHVTQAVAGSADQEEIPGATKTPITLCRKKGVGPEDASVAAAFILASTQDDNLTGL